MPFFSEYAIIRRLPPGLKYANGEIAFEIAEMPWQQVGTQWVFRARRIAAADAFCDITATPRGRHHLTRRLEDGFVLDEATPAAKVMERLVRDGYAVKRRAPREH